MTHWETARGASDRWQTPKRVFDALACRFDLDVAAPKTGPLHVPCDAWLDELAELAPWHGFVWMNPPFGPRNSLDSWLARFLAYGNGIALTPDRTSAAWFQKWAPLADRLVFLPKVAFLRPDGSPGTQPTFGPVLWGAGPKAVAVIDRAQGLGFAVVPRRRPDRRLAA